MKLFELRSIAEVRASENRPSGLTREQRGRLRDLWNVERPSPAERREIQALEARMR